MATYRCYYQSLETAAATTPTYFQKITPTNNIILTCVRSFVLQIDSPTYTSFTLKLYANRSSAPAGLIATSTTTWTKSDAFASYNSGLKEFYFNFNNIPLRGGETYHLSLQAVGYTGTETSHLGWKQSFPGTPVYSSGVDTSFEGLLISPYDITIIGSNQ